MSLPKDLALPQVAALAIDDTPGIPGPCDVGLETSGHKEKIRKSVRCGGSSRLLPRQPFSSVDAIPEPIRAARPADTQPGTGTVHWPPSFSRPEKVSELTKLGVVTDDPPLYFPNVPQGRREVVLPELERVGGPRSTKGTGQIQEPYLKLLHMLWKLFEDSNWILVSSTSVLC